MTLLESRSYILCPVCRIYKQNSDINWGFHNPWRSQSWLKLKSSHSMTSDSPKSSLMISVSPKKLKCFLIPSILYSVVQSLSRVWLFVTPWTASHLASLYFTISQSLLKLVSIEAMMPSSHLVTPFSSCPQSFPASSSFLMSKLITSGGQSIGALASASALPVNIQG